MTYSAAYGGIKDVSEVSWQSTCSTLPDIDVECKDDSPSLYSESSLEGDADEDMGGDELHMRDPQNSPYKITQVRNYNLPHAPPQSRGAPTPQEYQNSVCTIAGRSSSSLAEHIFGRLALMESRCKTNPSVNLAVDACGELRCKTIMGGLHYYELRVI